MKNKGNENFIREISEEENFMKPLCIEIFDKNDKIIFDTNINIENFL